MAILKKNTPLNGFLRAKVATNFYSTLSKFLFWTWVCRPLLYQNFGVSEWMNICFVDLLGLYSTIFTLLYICLARSAPLSSSLLLLRGFRIGQRILQHQNDAVAAQKQLRDEAVARHRLRLLLAFALLRQFRPHFLHVLQHHVAMSSNIWQNVFFYFSQKPADFQHFLNQFFAIKKCQKLNKIILFFCVYNTEICFSNSNFQFFSFKNFRNNFANFCTQNPTFLHWNFDFLSLKTFNFLFCSTNFSSFFCLKNDENFEVFNVNFHRSKALIRPSSFLLFRQFMSTWKQSSSQISNFFIIKKNWIFSRKFGKTKKPKQYFLKPHIFPKLFFGSIC